MTPLERAAYALNWQVDHQRRVAVICDALTDYLSNKTGGPDSGDADLCGGVALFLSAYIRQRTQPGTLWMTSARAASPLPRLTTI